MKSTAPRPPHNRHPLRMPLAQAFGLACVGAAFAAQGSAYGATDAKTDLKLDPPAEAHFLSKLHHANQSEIQVGTLARSRGKTLPVRDFGVKLVADHTNADRDLVALAKKDGIELENPVKALDEKEKAEMAEETKCMDELSKLNGADFDRRFKEMMIQDHAKDIAEVASHADRLPHADAQTLAKKVLPVLKEHEKIAKKLPGA